MVGIQGETVRISFYDFAYPLSVSISLYDAQNRVRSLAPFERLVIDRLETLNVNLWDSTLVPYSFVLLTPGGDNQVLGSTMLAALGPSNHSLRSTKEGVSVPLGITPSVLTADAGTFVAMTGDGRVVAESLNNPPTWKAVH